MRGLLAQPRATVQVDRWNGRETEPARGVKRQGPNGFPPNPILTDFQDTGTQKAAQYDAARWAPALQRTASRCAASGARDCCSTISMAAHPRGLFRPSFASTPHPRLKEGAGKTGCRPGTHGPLCERWQQESAQRHTGEAQHTAFPAQWFDGLCRVLPGERCTIAPVALPIADARARSGRHITARLGAQTPGARTTRFCRTLITPVVRATSFAHGCPPCDAYRADVTSVHRRPPRMS